MRFGQSRCTRAGIYICVPCVYSLERQEHCHDDRHCRGKSNGCYGGATAVVLHKQALLRKKITLGGCEGSRLGAAAKGRLDMPDGRSYWRREYLCATFIADSDEVPRFGEARPFCSDAMRNEGRVLFGFLFGRAFMPHKIVGANLSG